MELASQLIENATLVETNDQVEFHFNTTEDQFKEENTRHNYFWDNLGLKKQQLPSVCVCFVEKRYKCLFCPDSLTNITDVTKHMVIHYKQIQIVLNSFSGCLLDTLDVGTSDFDANSEKGFKSDDCEENPTDVITLYNSELAKSNRNSETIVKNHAEFDSQEKSYSCGSCGSQFTSRDRLKIHEASHRTTQTYDCHLCDSKFVSRSVLKTHKLTHLTKKKNPKGKSRKTYGDRNYVCDTCGKMFHHSSNLIVHKRVHTGEKPYICQFCGRAFASSPRLKTHLITHMEERTHTCNICGKAFKQSSVLKQHMAIHSEEKPFKCKICGKAFRRTSLLAAHSVIHSKEKRFKCDICGKTTNYKAQLENHACRGNRVREDGINTTNSRESIFRQFRSRNLGTAKRVECDICKKDFSCSYIRYHKMLHTQNVKETHKCEVCNREFRLKNALSTHMYVHSDSIPESSTAGAHQCQICRKTFPQESFLEEHMWRHTGVKRYKCHICGKAISKRENLHRHLKLHSRDRVEGSTD